MQEGVYDAFTRAVTKLVAGFKVGNGLEEGTTLGPLINDKAVQRVSRMMIPAQMQISSNHCCKLLTHDLSAEANPRGLLRSTYPSHSRDVSGVL